MNKKTTIRIKKKLIEKGIKQRDIACELKVHETAISLYINGKKKSRRFNDWIFENLNIEIK
ncbi:MAG: hypothetical protein ACOCWO_02555 [Candidatus Muiribacteriaceae bacterium]